MTMLGSFGGGFWSVLYSLFKNDGRVDILDLINGILASLVSVTAGCFLYRAWEAILVGFIGAILVCFLTPMFDRMGVDDPVGASAVHGIGGMWGVIAVGFFADDPKPLGTTSGRTGLFKGGGWYLVGIQTLAALCLLCWVSCSRSVVGIEFQMISFPGSFHDVHSAVAHQQNRPNSNGSERGTSGSWLDGTSHQSHFRKFPKI